MKTLATSTPPSRHRTIGIGRAVIVLMAVLVALVATGVAEAFNPPRVIGHIRSAEYFINWGLYYECVGDINNDGFDDLAVTWQEGGIETPLPLVEIYFGGDTIDSEPDLILRPEPDVRNRYHKWYYGRRFQNIGHFLPGVTNLLMIELVVVDSFIRRNGELTSYLEHIERFDFHTPSENIDTIPDFDWDWPWIPDTSRYWARPIHPFPSWNSFSTGTDPRPFDFNGDGYDDLVLWAPVDTNIYETFRPYAMQVCWGGENADSIPDWSVDMGISTRPISGVISGGFDVNGDDYQDMVVQTLVNSRVLYSLFLGGNPPDTTPVYQISHDAFWGRRAQLLITGGFCLLGDVNRDGYGDWGLRFDESPDGDDENDGYFIFFGSAQPDMEPDLTLEGHRGRWTLQWGNIVGGDFNGDGIDDIATSHMATTLYEINYHFGKRQIDGVADIYMRSADAYDNEADYPLLGESIGAVGDYNGDGIDDLVARYVGSRPDRNGLVILAGSRGWIFGVPEETLPFDYQIEVSAFPNPFNSQLVITIGQGKPARPSRLSIHDLQGRVVADLSSVIPAKAGIQSITWDASAVPAGLYIVRLESAGRVTARKVVLVR